MTEAIKDVTYEDSPQGTGVSIMGHPTLPQSPYPGYAVNYPTCSAPGGKNAGCDAFEKCTMPGEGPFNVVFVNKTGRKECTHCRHWMFKLQFKHAYRALGQNAEDVWMDKVEEEYIDPEEPKKGTKTKRYKMKVDNVKFPRPTREEPRGPVVPEIKDMRVTVNPPAYPQTSMREGMMYADRGTDYQGDEAGDERSVGSEGNRKGRGRPKGHDEDRG